MSPATSVANAVPLTRAVLQAPTHQAPLPRAYDRSGWSWLERWAYEQVTTHWRNARQPAQTRVLGELINKNPRTVRYALVALERRGAIVRKGQRGGWLPALRTLPA